MLDSLNVFGDRLWYVVLVLIVALGIYATVRLKGLQFRSMREMLHVTMRHGGNGSSLSSLEVFFVSMANRLGVGNIAGPVLAIIVGGPGAIFWMWVFAVIGMATSFMESTVGQLYKERRSDGDFQGGPAFTVKNGLGKRNLAIAIALIMLTMHGIGFCSMEVSAISDGVKAAVAVEHIDLIFAILITALTAVIMMKGVHTIADISVKAVPAMSILWFVFCFLSMAVSYQGIPDAVVSIFTCAFSVPAAVGGGLGAVMVVGMQRGVLSNEAGIGTITTISSMADDRHPAVQGYMQAFGVFVDTIISTFPALVVLSYMDIDAIVATGLDSMPLLEMVFSNTLGSAAPYLVAAFMFVFSYTSMLGDVVISSSLSMFLKDSRTLRYGVYAMMLVVIFLSSLYSSDELFAVVDLLMALCGLVNVFVMFRLSDKAVELNDDYMAQRAAGIDEPVFTRNRMRDPTGVVEWSD